MFAEVILPLNLAGTFTYSIPAELKASAVPGTRVLVPFGGKKIYTGIIAAIKETVEEHIIPKEVVSVLDAAAILPLQQLRFWQWLSEYYLCNLGEIYRFSFPGSLKLESETYLKLNPQKTIDWEVLDANEHYLLQALEVRQLISLQEVEAFIPKKDIIRTVNALIDEQLIFIDERITEKYKPKEIPYLKVPEHLLDGRAITEILVKLEKAPKQSALFLAVLTAQQSGEGTMRKSKFFENSVFGASHLKPLKDKGWIEEYTLQEDRISQYKGSTEDAETLTDAQQKAAAEIQAAFSSDQNVLLHGVTSSGKTHLYLHQIEKNVNAGKTVLLLVPEIALTKQMVARLERKFGPKLGFYHQKLTDFERVELWKKIKNDDLRIIVGTRSALFLPYISLGLVIVDEEHDSAYKPREVSPFFSARDAAFVLAKIYGANLILGSATPSAETFHAAATGKLAYVKLSERFGSVALPEVELVNLKLAQDTKEVTGNFSNYVLKKMHEFLHEKKQIVVLHNRRGYANVVECASCGYVTYCSNCDVVMTFHKFSNEMKCHYCGQKAAKPQLCPKCHSTNMAQRGVGIEQIEEELSKIFPEAEVDRMDVDSMRRKFAYEKLYEKITSGEAQIVVGTQMISKGLDFDSIEAVIVPRADQLLHVQDFRAEERAWQLITQVAGRAGRISGEGKVYIQTTQPENPVFRLIKEKDTKEIYDHFLDERRKFLYPPFSRLVLIEMKHRKEEKVDRASQFLGSLLRKELPEECVLGPSKAPVGKVNLLYNYQVLLKLPRNKNYQPFKKLLKKALDEFSEVSAYKSIKIQIFVDF